MVIRGSLCVVIMAESHVVSEPVVIGRIRKPIGLKGWCGVTAYGRALEALKLPCRVLIDQGGGKKNARILLSVEDHPKGNRCRFKGVGTREQAEELRDADIVIDNSLLPDLGESEFYHFELEGMQVVSEPGKMFIGTVKEVHNYPSVDALEIERTQGKPIVVPMTKETVCRVDRESGTISVSVDFLEEML